MNLWKFERLALLCAMLVIAWLVMVLVRVENERYAMSIGFCPGKPVVSIPDRRCLARIQTRTAWWAHVYYAALDFGVP